MSITKSLTIKVNDPIEYEEIDLAMHAGELSAAISDALQVFRGLRKFGEEQDAAWAEKADRTLWDIIKERNLERFF